MLKVKQFPVKMILTGFFLLLVSVSAYSQRYLADIDSSFFIKDTVRPVIKRFENLRISGYMQPQFQKAQIDGAPSFPPKQDIQKLFFLSRLMLLNEG